jgi:hypothetical protein
LRKAVLVMLAVLALLAACQEARPSREPLGRKPDDDRVPDLHRVVLIVMENKEFAEVIGDSEAPFLNGLARDYSRADQMFGVRHPSLPNYMALLSGSTQGIDSNCDIDDCSLTGPNLVSQLDAASISWKAYMEGMQQPCMVEDSGEYSVRHDPFVYFSRIRDEPALCSKVAPMTELTRDLGSGELPRFVWVTPGLCSDTHDCDVDEGDEFLARTVPPLLDALGPRGLLVITYDEGTSDLGCCRTPGGGHIPTVVAGPMARQGARSTTPYTLYSLLRTVEDGFGLDLLGHAGDAQTEPLTDLVISR